MEFVLRRYMYRLLLYNGSCHESTNTLHVHVAFRNQFSQACESTIHHEFFLHAFMFCWLTPLYGMYHIIIGTLYTHTFDSHRYALGSAVSDG